MRWLLITCAGCGRLAFEPRELTAPDAPEVDAPSAVTCTTATFEQPGIPAGMVVFGGGTVSVEAGRLRITVPGTDQVDAGLTAETSGSYAGHATALEVPGPSIAQGASTAIGWHQVTSGRLGVHVELLNGVLKLNSFDQLSSEYTEYVAVPYDAAAHRWWRLREEGGVVYGETSPDGDAWNLLGMLPGYDTTDVRWDLGLGAYVGAIAATESTFDNLVDCVPR